MSDNGFSDFGVTPEAKREPNPNWYDDLPPEQRAAYAQRQVAPPVSYPASQPAFPPQQVQQNAYQPRLYAPAAPVVQPNPYTPPVAAPQVTEQPYRAPVYVPPTALPTPVPQYAPPVQIPVQNYPPQQQPVYVQAPPKRKKGGNALVGIGVVLVLIAGILGGGLPAYRTVTNALSEATGGYVPSAGTGSSSPAVTSTDLATAVWVAQQVLDSASGKTDTEDLEGKIGSAKDLLAQPSSSTADLGKSQGELILSAENTKRALKVVQVEAVSAEVKRKLAAGEFGTGATREDDVRNMLDTLGGTDIGVIYKDNPCGMEKAAGCVSSEDPTVMYISPLILDKNYYEDYMLLQTVAHEYGHTVHFRTGYYRVLADSDVKSAFGDDPEHIADCMAEDIEGVVFTTYGYTCDAGQLAAARKIWTGNLSS